MPLRFCAYQYQNRPLAQLEERWRRTEDLGFDVLWNVDTLVEPDHPQTMMFDGPSTLAAMALRTRRIRIGTS
jgi:alkanesulfonate monooxygenase SsuD/methylene tetrahydromethanopterin reductase-like flavin-dependent oxidoreductase (luciferase family)